MAIPQRNPTSITAIIGILSNKKNFITEDKNGVGVYSSLFKKHLSEENHNNLKVYHSGGKKEMKKIYNRLKKINKEKNATYLVDLDFDDLLDIEKIIDPNFFYLKKYAIENYFVNKEVGEQLIALRNSINYFEAEEILRFEYWEDAISHQYKKIIALFLTIQQMNLTTENCDLSAMRFFNFYDKCSKKCMNKCNSEDKKYNICEIKINSYEKSVIEDLKPDLLNDFYETVEHFESVLGNSIMNLDIIPGKHILELYSIYLSSFLSKKIDTDVLIDKGVNYCEELDDIILKIIKVLYN